MERTGVGAVITSHQMSLLSSLKESFARAVQIKIVVSVILDSGVRVLLPDLEQAAARGVPLQILTSRDLNITEPYALYLLRRPA